MSVLQVCFVKLRVSWIYPCRPSGWFSNFILICHSCALYCCSVVMNIWCDSHSVCAWRLSLILIVDTDFCWSVGSPLPLAVEKCTPMQVMDSLKHSAITRLQLGSPYANVTPGTRRRSKGMKEMVCCGPCGVKNEVYFVVDKNDNKSNGCFNKNNTG